MAGRAISKKSWQANIIIIILKKKKKKNRVFYPFLIENDRIILTNEM